MVSNDEIRATLESLANTSPNIAVRRVMRRALVMLDNRGLEDAAVELLKEMAKTKKVQRELLWVGPAVALIFVLILFVVLAAFWKSI